jgi:hypothetical protein
LIASPSLEVCAFKKQFINRIITLRIHTQWRGGTVGAVWSAAFSRPASTQKRHATFYTCFALALCGALTVKRRAPVLFAAATSLFGTNCIQERELLRNIYVNACSHYYFYILLALHTPLCCWLKNVCIDSESRGGCVDVCV